MKQLYWFAGHDPVKIDEYLKMPLWEFWTILENQLSILETDKKKFKKY